MNTIRIESGEPYDVYVGERLCVGGLIRGALKNAVRAAVISDDTVFSLYGKSVTDSLLSEGFDVCRFVFPHGEASKSMAVLTDIVSFLAENSLTGTDAVIALGGGVVGDIAGFAAAVYRRGIDFVQIPTTLLAAVDSSVGGKTAVDLPCGKNLVGAFHSPRAVVCDTSFLRSLPEIQWQCGMAEVIKYAYLCDAPLFDRLHATEYDLSELIDISVRHKRDYVVGDEHDHGKRRFLNLGHTLGHAVETHSGYRLTHGAAVAVGMVYITRIAETMRLAPKGLCETLSALLIQNSLPVSYPIDTETLYKRLCADKKTAGNDITLILPTGIGQCILKTLPLTELHTLLHDTFGDNAV